MAVGIEQAFEYCPRCSTQHSSPGEIPFRCDKCEFTLFFGPVAAVGGLIVNESGELLLVRRARQPGKGLWGLPGGFVDRDETVEEALRREVIEETALQISEPDLLVTYPNEYNYKGFVSAVIDLFYVCRAAEPITIELAREELDQFVWTIPDDALLDQMAFPSNRRAIELWKSSTKS